LHPEDARDYHPIEAMRERVAKFGSAARYSEQYRIIRPDGDVRWVMDHGFPIVNEDGECYGVTGVAVDVTQQKQFEQALRDAKQAAEQARDAKDHFIRNMQHDIRTPFNGLYALSDILARTEADQERRGMLQDISKCSHELLEYCNSILDFSHIESGQQVILAKPFSLERVCQQVYAIELPAAKLKQLEFHFEMDSDIPKTLIGDQYRLQRIFINLISNAVKYTESGSVCLNVKLNRIVENGRCAIVQCVIKDTGPGISTGSQNVLFEKFARGVASYEGHPSGHGLGLRIVRQFVAEMDGDISLESNDKDGSCFTLSFPFKVPLVD
jgi:signal transduction histidine kinase